MDTVFKINLKYAIRKALELEEALTQLGFAYPVLEESLRFCEARRHASEAVHDLEDLREVYIYEVR